MVSGTDRYAQIERVNAGSSGGCTGSYGKRGRARGQDAKTQP